MALARYLADKSAFEQQRHSDAADGLLRALAADGALYMTEVVALELLYSARTSEYRRRWDGVQSLPWLHLDEACGRRALEIQRKLAETSTHRRPIPDLLIAAVAIERGATVLHYDNDFDLIADVAPLSAQWIVPRGTGHGRS